MRTLLCLCFIAAIPFAGAQTPAENGRDAGPPAATAGGEDLTTLPLGKGLPVMVRVGLRFQDITDFNDSERTFVGTVDMRLRWEDPRLRYPAERTPRGFQEYRGAKAEEKMKQVWIPGVAFPNLKGAPAFQTDSLRIFPNGWVELMERTTGTFDVPVDCDNFPFDTQTLGVEVTVRRETTSEASLIFLQEDLDFSEAAKAIKIDGWKPGIVTITRTTIAGWYGEFHSGLVVGLKVARESRKVVAPIFIPLLASLLIPLLAIWMNQTIEGEFTTPAFELANVIVGGLFAVIALNFTVNAEFKSVAGGDNMVTRLFGLNCLTMAASLAIVVFLYRYNVPLRLFGHLVQEQMFHYLSWAVPALVFGTALAFILVSAL